MVNTQSQVEIYRGIWEILRVIIWVNPRYPWKITTIIFQTNATIYTGHLGRIPHKILHGYHTRSCMETLVDPEKCYHVQFDRKLWILK